MPLACPPRLLPRVAIAIAIAIAVGAVGICLVDRWSSEHGLRLAAMATSRPRWFGALLDTGLWLFYAGFIGAFALGLFRRQRGLLELAAVYLAGELVFAAGLVRLLKIVCGRPRPFVGDAAWNWFSLTGDFHSLPSGHAADIMVGFAVVELSVRWRWLKVLAGVVAIVVMSARVLQGQHYLSDVAVGGLIGYLGGIAGIALHRRWAARTSGFRPTSTRPR